MKLRSAFLIFHHFIFSPSSVFYFIVSLGFEKLIIEGMKEFKISNLIFISCISIIYLPLIIIVAILLFCGFTGSCLLSVLLHNKLYKNFIKWVKSRIFDFKELFKSNLFEFSKLHVIFLVVIILVCMSQMGDRLQILFDNLFLRELNYKGDRWLTTLALLFLGLAGWHNYERYKSKTLLSTNWLFALGCTNLVIFLFWIKGSYCYALMCNGIPFLTYINCFVLINFIYLIGTLITAIHVNKIKFVRECPIILNPGKPINQDEINEAYEYKEYIDSIAPIIIDNFDEDVSVSVGISGAWGSGKTTFLHALQKQIKQDKRVVRKDRVLIAFKPWFCEKKTDLVQEFFKVYREHMGKRISGFDSDIMEYAKVLTENVDKLKWVNQVMKLCTPVESIQKQFDAITKKLKRYEIPVYIIIDDLDRLDGEEIMEILRLIRITANFPYTQFILAYDKPYIQKAIKKQLDYDDSERFIDKVINTEICLPHFDHLAIGNMLYNELVEYCDEVNGIRAELLNWNPIPGENNESSFASIIPSILPTFRDVHRFVNMFKLDFDKLKGRHEVDFQDFFILSLIKYAYPDFYRRMGVEPLQVLKYDSGSLVVKEELKEMVFLKNLLRRLFSKRVSNIVINDGRMKVRKEDLFISNRFNFNKYFQFKTPIYQYNTIDFLNAIEDQRLDYIKQKESVVKVYELERVLSLVFTIYQEDKNTEGLERLISFTDQLLTYDVNYKIDIVNSYKVYIKLPNSFNEKCWLSILSLITKDNRIDSIEEVLDRMLKVNVEEDMSEYKCKAKMILFESKRKSVKEYIRTLLELDRDLSGYIFTKDELFSIFINVDCNIQGTDKEDLKEKLGLFLNSI